MIPSCNDSVEIKVLCDQRAFDQTLLICRSSFILLIVTPQAQIVEISNMLGDFVQYWGDINSIFADMVDLPIYCMILYEFVLVLKILGV